MASADKIVVAAASQLSTWELQVVGLANPPPQYVPGRSGLGFQARQQGNWLAVGVVVRLFFNIYQNRNSIACACPFVFVF